MGEMKLPHTRQINLIRYFGLFEPHLPTFVSATCVDGFQRTYSRSRNQSIISHIIMIPTRVYTTHSTDERLTDFDSFFDVSPYQRIHFTAPDDDEWKRKE